MAISREGDGWTARPGSGGLVTALGPVLSQRRGLWIGWPGAPPEAPTESLLMEASHREGYSLLPVALTDEVVEGFYRGFSNEIIWPLFHDMLDRCVFDPSYWAAYREANACFADVIAEQTTGDDFVWIQDYHLMMVGEILRERGLRRHMGFFLHIPFPGQDLFSRLPWRRQLLEALLDYEVIGLQTERDRANFVRTLRELIPEAAVHSQRRTTRITLGDRESLVGHFPIGIDFDRFAGSAGSEETNQAAWLFHENLPNRRIMLGVDRLDYTKGVRRRLVAFGRCLEKYPDLHKDISLVQILVPSRTGVPEYQHILRQIEQSVGHINGRFSREGWVPVHYEYRSVPFVQLVGAYSASEVMLVTPLRDGMNLVAKEYCASHVDNRGVLILSEFAGAAEQLGDGAVVVNPNDVEGIADAIHYAYHMPEEEQRRRMKMLRSEVKRHDVHRWAASFLKVAGLS